MAHVLVIFKSGNSTW